MEWFNLQFKKDHSVHFVDNRWEDKLDTRETKQYSLFAI